MDLRPQGLHSPYNFMTRNERQARVRQLSVDDVQVSTAHCASLDSDPNLAGARFRFRTPLQLERHPWLPEHHRAHMKPLELLRSAGQATGP